MPPVWVILGAAALLGGTGLLLSRAFRRTYRRGLLVGDSMLASPLMTGALTTLTQIPWDNVAVVGANSARVLGQVRSSFQPAEHDIVVVSVGANDGVRNASWTGQNVRAIADAVKAGGADLVILTEPPLRGYRRAVEGLIRRSEAHRNWVLAGGPSADKVVDLHRVLGGEPGHIMPTYDAGDGLHPNRAGRLAMAREIARRIM